MNSPLCLKLRIYENNTGELWGFIGINGFKLTLIINYIVMSLYDHKRLFISYNN